MWIMLPQSQSHIGALHYIVEDNEAVIKMITKDRKKSDDETRVPKPQSRVR